MKRQQWRRLGRIFEPETSGAWAVSHAAYPTTLVLDDGAVRIFFSVRDALGRSSLASVDFAISPAGAERTSDMRGPLLSPGERGAFDADGVTVTSLVRLGDRTFAYYLGWAKGVSVPFNNFIGLAFGDREGTRFERSYRAPIMGRSEFAPLTLSYPWGLLHAGAWRMWFGSCVEWGPGPRDHVTSIREAMSVDGITWLHEPQPVLSPSAKSGFGEYTLARPTVIAEPAGFSMWYARLETSYRLGYAWSSDGNQWERRDDALCFSGEPAEWEREQTYPCVFDHEGRRFMLYNGHGYGATGFGLAVLEC